MRALVGLGLLAGSVCSAANGAIILNLSKSSLAPNTDGQTIDVLVTTDANDTVSSMDLYAQFGDGGIDNGGAANSGPFITGVELKAGTIFSMGTPSDPASASDGMIVARGIDGSASVAASGKVATLTISTVGITGGTFELSFENVAQGIFGGAGMSTEFSGGGSPVAVRPGSAFLITVPEPGICMALAATCMGALSLRRRQVERVEEK